MPKKHGRRKKARPKNKDGTKDGISDREKKYTPRCLVIKRGAVGARVKELVLDFRKVMLPNTSKKLQEKRRNCLQDFVAVAGILKLSHLIIFTATKTNTWMKIVKLPEGPTLTFQVDSFSLSRDVTSQQKRRYGRKEDTMVAPLQVLNGFVRDYSGGVKDLLVETLRGLFPPVDIPTFNQAECRRTALFHLERATDTVHFRHFCVVRRQLGLQQGVAKLLKTRRVPKMGRCQDIADFVLSGGAGTSETEVEGLAEVPILSAKKNNRTAVRLHEIGPRLCLLLVKAEAGVCNGTVIFHRFKTKLPSAEEVLQAKAREKRKMREQAAEYEAKAAKEKAKRKELARQKREREEERDNGEDDEPDYKQMAAAVGNKRKKRSRP